jgi:SAM-dependent methyltransferase
LASRILLVVSFCVIAVTASSQALWPAFVVASLVATLLVAVAARSDDLSFTDVILFALIFRLLLLPLLPSVSDDGYRFVWDGLVQWLGINPYRFTPSDAALAELQQLPIFTRLNSPDYFSVYPPMAQVVFFLGGFASIGGWAGSFLLIKLIITAIEFLGVIALTKMVTARNVVLYAWNPLVVVEIAGQAHTEGLMVSFLLLTIWAYRSNRASWSLVSLTAAIWVKLYPVLLLPFLLRRTGWRWIWVVFLVSVVLVAPYAETGAPAHVVSSVRLYLGTFEFYAAPYLVLKAVGYAIGGSDGVEQTVGFLLAGILLSYAVWLFVEDGRRTWNLVTVCWLVLLGYYVTATTVHPWYFVPLMGLVPLVQGHRAAWIWLASLSTGTYLLYSHEVYWLFVWLGWGGWILLLAGGTSTGQTRLRKALNMLLRWRAQNKAKVLAPFLSREDETSNEILAEPPRAILDLGAGEGFVGREIADLTGSNVTLCDIRAANRTSLPYVIYDGRELPFDADWFETTIVVFALHHCDAQEVLLSEAARVTKDRIVILESIYDKSFDRWLLTRMDRLANFIRSHGEMDRHVYFRSFEGWIDFIESKGLAIRLAKRWGIIHRQALIVIDL